MLLLQEARSSLALATASSIVVSVNDFTLLEIDAGNFDLLLRESREME